MGRIKVAGTQEQPTFRTVFKAENRLCSAGVCTKQPLRKAAEQLIRWERASPNEQGLEGSLSHQ